MKSLSCLWFSLVALAASCLAQTPADTVGYTQQFYQTGGPSGQRIVVDGTGNIHVVWMKAMPFPSVRRIYFNCKTATGWVSSVTGSQVDYGTQGAGYPQIASTPDDRSVIAYHKAPTNAESLYVARDAFSCLGSFNYGHPPAGISGAILMWPYISVGQNGNIHLVATRNIVDPLQALFIYTRSTDNGVTWSGPEWVNLTRGGAITVSSPVSNRTAIVFARPINVDSVSSHFSNDIWAVESPDGVTWDFTNDLFNITDYPFEDSIYANNDLDAIYDYNDNLHIVWVGQGYDLGEPSETVQLYHYSTHSGTISEVARYSMTSSGTCEFPFGFLAINMVSLAVSDSGDLYAVYTRFDTTDCSRIGEANGDLFAQYSRGGGLVWSNPVNITNTRTPDCLEQHCISEVSPSAAESADDYLHVACTGYNGGPSLWGGAESPVLYYEYPVAALGVDEAVPLPRGTRLSQNYPNPFNAQTTISFALAEPGDVSLEVYDLLGRRIETLHQGKLAAGGYNITWDAGDRASGVYFVRLSAGEASHTRTMTLLK